MNNFLFSFFLKLLLKNYQACKWHGWRKGAEQKPPYGRSWVRGSFIAFSAHVEGFTIIIKEHDYSHCFDPQKGVERHRDVFGRRPELDRSIDYTWIEIEIQDLLQRFGRTSIFGRQVISTRDPNYERSKKLFDAIKSIGELHLPQDDRLSAPRALVGFCRQIRDHAAAQAQV